MNNLKLFSERTQRYFAKKSNRGDYLIVHVSYTYRCTTIDAGYEDEIDQKYNDQKSKLSESRTGGWLYKIKLTDDHRLKDSKGRYYSVRDIVKRDRLFRNSRLQGRGLSLLIQDYIDAHRLGTLDDSVLKDQFISDILSIHRALYRIPANELTSSIIPLVAGSDDIVNNFISSRRTHANYNAAPYLNDLIEFASDLIELIL